MARADPIRVLTAVPICDGHDSAINTINLELIHNGIEVIYLGYHRSASDIVRAAIQEGVRAIGISSYNGGHVEFFGEVIQRLRRRGAGDIGLFGGGGGTISAADARIMQRQGVDRIFPAGTSLAEVVQFVHSTYGTAPSGRSLRDLDADRRLARRLTAIEGGRSVSSTGRQKARRARRIGITGPGGAGKTTLIDELVLRFLKNRPNARVAILSHDPSLVDRGALLGDRATMIYSQHDRVFMRSLATRGAAGGLARRSRQCLAALDDFDVVFVETVGIGQESSPFGKSDVDVAIFVMSPDYGSRLQLQKIVMLDRSDLVVLNKADLSGAKTALAEMSHRLGADAAGQRVLSTIASRHADAGVDALFTRLQSESEPAPAPRARSKRKGTQ
jgi:methylmalonyl-CoA mutase